MAACLSMVSSCGCGRLRESCSHNTVRQEQIDDDQCALMSFQTHSAMEISRPTKRHTHTHTRTKTRTFWDGPPGPKVTNNNQQKQQVTTTHTNTIGMGVPKRVWMFFVVLTIAAAGPKMTAQGT
eukprot:6474400-Amphidinium_carterae.2